MKTQLQRAEEFKKKKKKKEVKISEKVASCQGNTREQQGKTSRPHQGQASKWSCKCHAPAQQHQYIPLSPFSHPASTLFMMFCYYWQGVCMLYPASLARPCFLCFQNGSPHPLFENQCYQEISKKKMVVAFWHLTIRGMLRWRKQDTSHVSGWPEESVARHLSPDGLLGPRVPFHSSFTMRNDPAPSQIFFVKVITKKVTEITHFYGTSFCCSSLAYCAKAQLMKCKCLWDNLLKDTNLQLITGLIIIPIHGQSHKTRLYYQRFAYSPAGQLSSSPFPPTHFTPSLPQKEREGRKKNKYDLLQM